MLPQIPRWLRVPILLTLWLIAYELLLGGMCLRAPEGIITMSCFLIGLPGIPFSQIIVPMFNLPYTFITNVPSFLSGTIITWFLILTFIGLIMRSPNCSGSGKNKFSAPTTKK